MACGGVRWRAVAGNPTYAECGAGVVQVIAAYFVAYELFLHMLRGF